MEPGVYDTPSQACKARVLANCHHSPILYSEQVVGLEPTLFHIGSVVPYQLGDTCKFVGKVGFEPTFSTSRYVYRMYKIPTVLAEIKKPSPFETGF